MIFPPIFPPIIGFPPVGRTRTRQLNGNIPVVHTTGVAVSSDGTQLMYNINPCLYRSLPTEGLIMLTIDQAPPSSSEALPIYIGVGNNTELETDDALTEPITGADIKDSVSYLVHYNKRNHSFCFVNYTPDNASE